MDSQPKRRVLSLSLSQPSKQNKKLKLKRHISTCSEKEKNISPHQGSQRIDRLRDDVDINLAVCNPTTSKPEDVHTVDDTIRNERISSSTVIGGRVKKSSDEQTAKESKLQSEEGLTSAQEEIKIVTSQNLTTEMEGGPLKVKVEPILERTRSRSKVIEKVPSRDQFFNSPTKFSEDIKEAMHEKRNLKSSILSETVSSSSTSNLALSIKLDGNTLISKWGVLSSDAPPSSEAVSSKMPDENRDSNNVPSNADDECLEILQCPLCSKMFDKLASKTTHMKSCASKNKVSTQQLLEALELQRRQAAERKALGLPGIPPVSEKPKKPPATKKETRPNSKIDSNLQLALALSLSMQDQGSGSTELAKVLSLDHFGFTSKSVLDSVQSRPSAAPLPRGKTKGGKKATPTLLTRTAEERQRIITEKVAMVLLEEVASEKNEDRQALNIKSSFLHECLDKETALWAKSRTSPSKHDRTSFYVQNLRGFISPSKVEMGSKVMHLSQVAGRVKTPTKVHEQKDNEAAVASPSDEEISSDPNSPQQNESKDPTHIEMELRAKLFNDWASMVNNSSMSDLTIYPQEGREIPAHKIVLHVRCHRILQDVCRQRNPLTGNEVEVIMWSRTPHAAALAFLEYVYCGSVKSVRVLSEDPSSILWLANHYKVADLIRYLSAVSEIVQTSQTSSQVALSVVKDFDEQLSERENCNEKDKVSYVKESNVMCLGKLLRKSLGSFASPVGTSRSETESIYSEATVAGAANPSSPDMFSDEDDLKPSEASEGGSPCSDDPMCLSGGGTARQNLFDNVFIGNNENIDRPPSRSDSVLSGKTVIVERNSPISRRSSTYSEKTVVDENNSRPVSRCSSVSSEKTVVVERSPPPVARCASVSSEKIVVGEKNSPVSRCSSASSVETVIVEKSSPVPRSSSVSSEKTVILKKNSPPVSRCGSVSSERTVLRENHSPPLSPASSNASAATDVLDFNQSGSKRSNSPLNDSKRKHSDSSQDGDTSLSKRPRPRPVGSTSGQLPEKKDSDVEFCDLTQDSDSNTSFPTIHNNLSGNSSEKICISSDIDNSGVEANNKSPVEAACETMGCVEGSKDRSRGVILDKMNKSNEEVKESSPGKSEAPYVSPVWDGFEDLHYDPFFSDFAVNSDSPAKVTEPSGSGAEIFIPSPCGNESLLSGNKSPETLKFQGSDQPECQTVDGGSSSDCEMTFQSQTVIVMPKRSNPSTSNSFDALLDDSLNINDTILQQAENGMPERLTQQGTKGTPVNRVLSSEPDGVTPMANYSAMKTPELKRELQKFGLKPTLGKRKGKIMLRHIYNELHPWVPTNAESLQERGSLSQPSHSSIEERDVVSCNQPNSRKLTFSISDPIEKNSEPVEKEFRSTDSNSNSDSESDSDNNRSMSMQEIQYLEEDGSDDEPMSQGSSQRVNKADLPKIVSNFIRKDPELFHKVLEYEPILIEKLQLDLRTNGFKFKLEDLMGFLDEKCITFRSAPSGPRVKRRKPKDAAASKKSNANANDLSD